MKKLFVLLSALMLIFAVSCSNDTPSVSVDAVMIDPIEIPETTDNLSGDVKAAFDEILGEITMESEFENVILKTDVQATYYEGKCIANAVLVDENTIKMTIVSPVAGFMPGDTITILQTGFGEITGDGDIFELANIMERAENRSLVEGAESLRIRIEEEEYNLDFDCKKVMISNDSSTETSHVVITLDKEYKGLSTFELYYASEYHSYSEIVCKIGDAYYSVENDYKYEDVFRAIEKSIFIPW